MSRANAIGLFGGTFDPIHFGHLRAALEARDALGLESLRFLPAGSPPLRIQPLASPAHRLAMLEHALKGVPGFSIDDREIRRDGPSYMVDTLAEIRCETPAAPLILLVGQDAANRLDRWHQWPRLFELAHLAVMRRPDSTARYSEELADEMCHRQVAAADDLFESPAGCVFPLEITQLDISATAIRELVSAGHSPRFLLPDAVLDYIRKNPIY